MTLVRVFFITFIISISFLNIDADNPSSSAGVTNENSAFASASIFSTLSSTSRSSSTSSSTTAYSLEFFCKVCGKTLFDSADHITGTILSGPRLITAYHDPELGPRGTIHTMLRSHTAGTIDVAVFRDTVIPSSSVSTAATGTAPNPTVKLVGPSENPVFPGYVQHQTICGRCGQPIGWKFDRSSTLTPSIPTSSTPSTHSSHTHTPTTTSTSTTSSSSSPTLYQVIPYVEGEETYRLASLDDHCYNLPRGWWTYEVCTKRKVRQFHRQTDGTINPDWSLGDYDIQGKIERVRPLSPVTGYYSSHFYTNGQRCDETGKGRATEVQYFCCSTSHMTTNGPYIEDIEEPSLCRYRVKLCVPSLCVPVGTTPSSLPITRIDDETIVEQTNNPADSGHHRSLDESVSTMVSSESVAETKEAELLSASSELLSASSDTTSSSSSTDPTSSSSFSPYVPQPPDTTYSPQGLPHSFMLASWNAILGSNSETYDHLKGNDYVTGIAPVRFQ